MASLVTLIQTLTVHKYILTSQIFHFLHKSLNSTYFGYYKDYAKLIKNEVNLKSKIRFFLKCRSSNILPPHIHKYMNNCNLIKLENNRNKRLLQNKIMDTKIAIFKNELNDLYFKLKQNNDQIKYITQKLTQTAY